MKEELITLDTAIIAKEKGFNITTPQIFYRHTEVDKFESSNNLCVGDGYRVYKKDWSKYFTLKNVIYKPTQSLLQRWLREVHNIFVNVKSEDYGSHTFHLFGDDIPTSKWVLEDGEYEDTYEEALEKGLQEALKLIK